MIRAAFRRLHVAYLRWRLDCIEHDRAYLYAEYTATPRLLRLYREQASRLKARIDQLEVRHG